MAKYSKKAGEKVAEAMHEKKEGTLKTGTGKKVTSKKQAIAMACLKQKKKALRCPKRKVKT